MPIPHPRVPHPLPGRVNHIEDGPFVAICHKCSKVGHGDFGMMGADHIRQLLEASGWTLRTDRKKERWLCADHAEASE